VSFIALIIADKIHVLAKANHDLYKYNINDACRFDILTINESVSPGVRE